MKIKITTKCGNCDLKEESFIFDTEVNYSSPGFMCSGCKSRWYIKVSEIV